MENKMKKETVLRIIIIIGVVLLMLGGLSVMLLGAFNTASIIVLSLGAALSVVYFVAEKNMVRDFVKRKSTRYGINAAIYTLLIIGVVIVVQAIITVNSKQFDLTKTKEHSLSDQTMKALGSLKNNVNVYYFYSINTKNFKVEDMLKMYEKKNSKFKFHSIDADKNPAVTKKLKVDRYGVVVMERTDNNTTQQIDSLTEEGITNGLLRINKEEKKKIYFTKGHGEPNLDAPKNNKTGYSVIRDMMTSQNYHVLETELYQKTAVPSACKVLVIAGPLLDIYPQEYDMIKKYLMRGGKLFVLYPPMQKLPRLEKLMKEFGIESHKDIVVDKVSKMMGGDYLMPVISDYDFSEITRTMGNTSTFFPMSRSYDVSSEIKGIKQTAIARTNPSSWGEVDIESVKNGKTSQGKGDYEAPLVIAAISEIDFGAFDTDASTLTLNTQAKIVAFGSSEIVNNTYVGISLNRDLFINTISYLAEEDDLIAIRAKDRTFEPLFLSKIQGRMLFIIPTIFLPLLVLGIGIMVFVRRKRK